MKLILVPPGLAEPMMRALKLANFGLERTVFPPVAGMPILVSPIVPPGTAYILQGEAIPRVEESLWRNTYLGSWEDVEEPEPKYQGMTFAIDYGPTIIECFPRPKLTRWQRLQNRLHWRVWMVWFVVRDWWRRMVEESSSPFRD